MAQESGSGAAAIDGLGRDAGRFRGGGAGGAFGGRRGGRRGSRCAGCARVRHPGHRERARRRPRAGPRPRRRSTRLDLRPKPLGRLDGHQRLQAVQEQIRELEKERKGEKFTLIDPAILPEEPVSPNRPAIIFLSLVLALGAGVGSAAEDLHQRVDHKGKVNQCKETKFAHVVLPSVRMIA